jgi:hypothetical protein
MERPRLTLREKKQQLYVRVGRKGRKRAMMVTPQLSSSCRALRAVDSTVDTSKSHTLLSLGRTL